MKVIGDNGNFKGYAFRIEEDLTLCWPERLGSMKALKVGDWIIARGTWVGGVSNEEFEKQMNNSASHLEAD